MEKKRDEDMWLGCCLGFQIGKYLSDEPTADQNRLIQVLGEIARGEVTLHDPGQSAAQFSSDKEVLQSMGHAAIRSDRDMARRALDQLSNGHDE